MNMKLAATFSCGGRFQQKVFHIIILLFEIIPTPFAFLFILYVR